MHSIFGTFMVLVLSSSYAQEHSYSRIRPGRVYERKPVIYEEETTTYKPKVYEIRSQIAPNIGDGNFGYYVETSDGLQAQQHGYIQKPLASQVHEGAYTTFDDTGKIVLVNYVADKDGFRAGGDSLPTSPPVPLEHAKIREDILKLQQDIRQQHLAHFRAAHAAYGRKY